MASPPSAALQEELSLLHPAGILEKGGIKACIVGTAALRLFGSDLLMNDLDLAIAEEDFDLALSLLHGYGFEDIDFAPSQLRDMPALGKPGGWAARRLRYRPFSNPITLNPARCWHLDITPDTTFLPYPCPYRFPRFIPYLEALIQVLDTRMSSRDYLWPINYHYKIMVHLLQDRPEDKARISPANRFFIEFYAKQLLQSGEAKVLKLRRRIMDGALSVEDAIALVPRHDLLIKQIKEKYDRLEMERGNDKENTPKT
ncbi:hypothetical protein C7212DRAFT_284154 [Tuber magnatum]|uniref:Nucleotidyltransferase n=1 Tax=Tuber magnatum TaxID=42249 RepID=A0A317SH65_9PEZI|nr:hypothetical protein C7212DRAFT_284154 [Tuber magnatum]